MEVFSTRQALRRHLKTIKKEEKSIGFVPTMGALHEGHLSLIRSSKAQNDVTISSIFVNPTQFNNPDDLKNYPRDTEKDLEKLREAGCDAVYLPGYDDLYDKDIILSLNFGYLEEIMEGRFRPGHFKGVGLVVTKLFNIVEPDRAYFGKKDLQQLALIRTLVRELRFDIEIVAVETVREQDGLAMSSRNQLLSPEERAQATSLFQALSEAKRKLLAGESVKRVKNYVAEFIGSKAGVRLEYFEIVTTTDLRAIDEFKTDEKVSLCIAAYVGNVRLIDNLSII